MDIFGNIRNAFQHADPNQIIHQIEDGVVHVANDAQHQLEGVANSAKHELEGALRNAKHEIVGKLDNAIHTIEGKVTDAEHAVQGKLNWAQQQFVGNTTRIANDLKTDLTKVGETIKTDTEKLVKEALESIAKGFGHKGIQLAHHLAESMHEDLAAFEKSDPELVEEINNTGFGFQIGPISCEWTNFYDRSADIVELLAKYTESPPGINIADIKKLILAVGPTTITISVSIGLALGIDSDVLEAGAWANIPTKLGVLVFAKALKKLGVPES